MVVQNGRSLFMSECTYSQEAGGNSPLSKRVADWGEDGRNRSIMRLFGGTFARAKIFL